MNKAADIRTGDTGAASPEPRQGAKETSTVRRVLLLLQCLADHPGETAQSLARRLNLPRSSVHRLLAMLRDSDYVSQEPGGRFGPGLEMYRIAGKLGAHMPYSRMAEPYLQALCAQFNETSILTLLERQQLKMFHAASGSPPDPMRYNIRLNALEPLLWGATARVMLAHLSDEEIHSAIARKEPSPADGHIADEAELRASLRAIRADGYAITLSHRTANAIGAAAPIFNGKEEIVGSLGLLIPEFRWLRSEQDGIIHALRQAAAELSRQLGYSRRSPR